MSPSERPSNDNEGAPVLWEDTPLGKRVFGVVSVVVLALIYGGGYLYLSPEKWQGMWIVIGLAVVGMVVAAIYRLIVYGKA